MKWASSAHPSRHLPFIVSIFRKQRILPCIFENICAERAEMEMMRTRLNHAVIANLQEEKHSFIAEKAEHFLEVCVVILFGKYDVSAPSCNERFTFNILMIYLTFKLFHNFFHCFISIQVHLTAISQWQYCLHVSALANKVDRLHKICLHDTRDWSVTWTSKKSWLELHSQQFSIKPGSIT